MTIKITTFKINKNLWKRFKKRLIDEEYISKEDKLLGTSKVSSLLIRDFLAKKINIDIFEEEKKEINQTVSLHIKEDVWLDLDTYLAKQRRFYKGDKNKQKMLNKGNLLIKLIKYYIGRKK